ncbi:uncharacterized protein LOC122794690 [Protopterus annectens]|uniref:uncharacterized protein LOC122794690 n=1 Tax=Protopterus annectens TaxID=7888 RepID=UPI001CFB1DBA|nr:uncharacterized protein LOC122794690 [Protopterus annectens]
MTVMFGYGYALVTWPIVGCVDSYFLQLSALDGYTTLQQQIVYGGSASFYGLQLCSSYNLTIQAMFQGENCLPLTQEFTYFGTHLCDSLDMTVTSLANGAIQANWTNIQCIDSYRLQLYKADTSTLLEQKIVNGSLVIFTGPYDHSVYNVILWAMYSDEQCPPVEKQITHFGKKTTVIAKAEVLATGREPIDEQLIKDALENEVYDLLKPELRRFVKVRVVQV